MKNEKRSKIAVFGGSFDPPHFAHTDIVENLEKLFDRVIVVPSYISPFKSGAERADMRLKLCKRVFSSDKTEVLGREIKRGGLSYSVDTAAYLAKKYGGGDLYWVIGSEELARLGEWHNIDKLKTLVKFYVVLRPGFTPDAELLQSLKKRKIKIKIAKFEGVGVSSSRIKIDTAFGMPNCAMPDAVRAFSQKHGLFDPYGEYVNGLYKYGLKPHRIAHTYRVAVRGAELAKLYGANVNDAVVACILHDIGKSANTEDYKNDVDLAGFPAPTAHAPIGAYIAKRDYGVSDEIAHAIKVHSTGCGDMSVLDAIVYLADKTESGRSYESAEYLRYLCSVDINLAMRFALTEINGLDRIEKSSYASAALAHYAALCGNAEYPEMPVPEQDRGSGSVLPAVRHTTEIGDVELRSKAVAEKKNTDKSVAIVSEKSKELANTPSKAVSVKAAHTPVSDSESGRIAEAVCAELDLHKAHDIDIIDLDGKTIVADYFVLASATSTTAVQALYGYVEDKLKKQFGIDPLRRDVDREWVALDYGGVIVHIFTDKMREFYNIERLWSDGTNVTRRGEK